LATATNAVAVGTSASAPGAGATALGTGASASRSKLAAFGSGATHNPSRPASVRHARQHLNRPLEGSNGIGATGALVRARDFNDT